MYTDLFFGLWLTEDLWDIIQTDVDRGDSSCCYWQQGFRVTLVTKKILYLIKFNNLTWLNVELHRALIH